MAQMEVSLHSRMDTNGGGGDNSNSTRPNGTPSGSTFGSSLQQRLTGGGTSTSQLPPTPAGFDVGNGRNGSTAPFERSVTDASLRNNRGSTSSMESMDVDEDALIGPMPLTPAPGAIMGGPPAEMVFELDSSNTGGRHRFHHHHRGDLARSRNLRKRRADAMELSSDGECHDFDNEEEDHSTGPGTPLPLNGGRAPGQGRGAAAQAQRRGGGGRGHNEGEEEEDEDEEHMTNGGVMFELDSGGGGSKANGHQRHRRPRNGHLNHHHHHAMAVSSSDDDDDDDDDDESDGDGSRDSGSDGDATDSDVQVFLSPSPEKRKRSIEPPPADAPFHPSTLLLVHKKQTSPCRRLSSERRRPEPQLPEFHTLPMFSQVQPAQHEALFVNKLKHCCYVFDFCEGASDAMQRQCKTDTLLEMLYFMRQLGPTPQLYPALCEMLRQNAFREFPPPASFPDGAEFDAEEDDPRLEETWPHLQYVYELIVVTFDHPMFEWKSAARCFDLDVATQLYALLDSEDPRERDLVKAILHRMYSHFVPFRAALRKLMFNTLSMFLYENVSFNGVAETLELYGSIINGLSVPVKPEHRHMLFKLLVPLHKARQFTVYHPQLCYCVTRFVQKDPTLTVKAVNGLLRLWPKVHSTKEVIFLNELEEILENVSVTTFDEIKTGVVQRLIRSSQSQHFQVADRSLAFWSRAWFLKLVTSFARDLVPLAFPTLYKHSKQHWHKNIHSVAEMALRSITKACPSVVDECMKDYQFQHARSKQDAKLRRSRWAQLEQAALRNPLSSRIQLNLMTPDEVAACGDKRSRSPDDEDEVEKRSKGGRNKEAIMLKNTRLRRNSFVPRDEDVVHALQDHHVHPVGISDNTD